LNLGECVDGTPCCTSGTDCCTTGRECCPSSSGPQCGSGQACEDGLCICSSGLTCEDKCCQPGEICHLFPPDEDTASECLPGTCESNQGNPPYDYCTNANNYVCGVGCVCATSIGGAAGCRDFRNFRQCVPCATDAACGPGKVCIPQSDDFCAVCTGMPGFCVSATCPTTAGRSATDVDHTSLLVAGKSQLKLHDRRHSRQARQRSSKKKRRRQHHDG
jgi:hypothetical protein